MKSSIVAERLNEVAPSMTKAITQRASELKESGVEVITLSHGEADFDTPENVQRAGMQAIRDGKTLHVGGGHQAPARGHCRQAQTRQ